MKRLALRASLRQRFDVTPKLGRTGGALRVFWPLLICLALTPLARAQAVNFDWSSRADGVWLGSDFWANRLQDWRVEDHRLTLTADAMQRPLRTVHVLTHRLSDQPRAGFAVEVDLGLVDPAAPRGGFAGLLVGAGGSEMSPAAASIIQWSGRGAGIFAGIDAAGRATIQDFETPLQAVAGNAAGAFPADVRLNLSGGIHVDGYRLSLNVIDLRTGDVIDTAEATFPSERLVGNVALAAAPGESRTRYWFDNLQLRGERFTDHPSARLGPLLAAQYTLSRGVLKLTAQLVPLADDDPTRCVLQTRRNGQWTTIAETEVIVPGYTAPFRVESWNDRIDHELRLVYSDHTLPVTVRRDPVHGDDGSETSVAVLNCLHQNSHSLSGSTWGGGTAPPNDWLVGLWFPHDDLVDRVAAHDPDMLFFTGDQIYEGASPTPKDLDHLELDYLYKWYMFLRSFGELTANRPTVTIPDDHDVFQGNLWGASGRPARQENHGGYLHPAWFVNMVERTQTSHLPDPVDPEPIAQNIGVYFTDMVYGGVGFAIVEDRKFKSGVVDPETGERADPSDPSLTLLGERQLDFLRRWTADWEGQYLKAVLSQTVFAQANTHTGAELEHNPRDFDTNGFPVPGRRRAVETIRRGFAVHLCGDQHLSTLLQHGVDAFGDAFWSFCAPAAANFWPRGWAPRVEGRYRFPERPEDYLGDFTGSWGNRITMFAVANPGGPPTGLQPTDLYDRMPGYGIARFDTRRLSITFESWPRHANPHQPHQYPGWPRTVELEDNYARTPVAYLPRLTVRGIDQPVIRVTHAETGELVYARRFLGPALLPGVFHPGDYIIEVGEPGTQQWRRLGPFTAIEQADDSGRREIEFE